MKTIKSYMTGSLIALFVMIFSFSGFSTKWVVTVMDFQFTPSSISNVNLGDTIRWVWVNGTHTTTSTTIPSGAASWDQPIDVNNTSYEYPTTVAGTYNYHCMHHPSQMIASFTVTGFTPVLNVIPSNQNVTATMGSTAFTVTSNTSWTASTPAGWCNVTPSGSGNGTITANYQENTTFVQRVASITVSASGVSDHVVTVTQAAATHTILVTPNNQNVTAAAGTTDFTVTSNSDWLAVSNSIWCTVTPSGTGNGTITANYSANSGPPRTDTITVTVTGLAPQKVTVNQDGTTGIAKINGNTFHVYPNPTSGQITIIPGGSQKKTDNLTVIDLTGKTIFSDIINSDQQYTIDLSSYPGGYYFVQLTSESGTMTKKVILDK